MKDNGTTFYAQIRNLDCTTGKTLLLTEQCEICKIPTTLVGGKTKVINCCHKKEFTISTGWPQPQMIPNSSWFVYAYDKARY